MSSIVIDYLYRDAGNNKRHGRRVLANPTGITPEALLGAFKKAFRTCQLFPDIVHFDPAVLGWEELFFPDHDADGDDIGLHELAGISNVDDASSGISADTLLQKLLSLNGGRASGTTDSGS